MVAICLTVGGLSTSCDRSLPVESEGDGVIIQLNVPKELEVTTKGGALDGIEIGDVWVLQYTKNTDELLKAKKYPSTAITPGANTSLLNVLTTGFSEADSRFYVIANGGDNFLTQNDTLRGEGKTPITQVQLKQKTLSLTNYTSSPTFATAGPIELTQDSIRKYGGKAIIVAPLERAFAKVSLRWRKSANFSGKLTIKEVAVCNLPTSMAAYARGGGLISDKYPTDISSMESKKVITSGDLGAGSEQPFYMPENLRGMGTGITFSEKTVPSKGPGGNVDGCTFVLLSGEYQYALGDGTYSSVIKVLYKIFLGGNLTNDYNIQRGYLYNLTVNIGGANSSDVRVTITDGRAVVFDDVTIMDPIIVDF